MRRFYTVSTHCALVNTLKGRLLVRKQWLVTVDGSDAEHFGQGILVRVGFPFGHGIGGAEEILQIRVRRRHFLLILGRLKRGNVLVKNSLSLGCVYMRKYFGSNRHIGTV